MNLEYVRPDNKDVNIFVKDICENSKKFEWQFFFEFLLKEYEGRCTFLYRQFNEQKNLPQELYFLHYQNLIYVEIRITNSQSRFYGNLVGLRVNDFGSGDDQYRLVDAFCFVFSLIASEHFLFNKTWTFDQIKPEVTRLTKELLDQFVSRPIPERLKGTIDLSLLREINEKIKLAFD